MAKTPNIALNIIPFDQIPWDVQANENTTIIDGVIGQYFAVANFVGVWENATTYVVGQNVIDSADGTLWLCGVGNTSPVAPTTFAADRIAHPANWSTGGPSAAASAAAADASATAAAASALATSSLAANPNYVNNSGFSINQRAYVSGAALGIGAFGHDRWKGGPAGCTYTFVQSTGPSTVITITAGLLQQTIEGAQLVGGDYTLSWAGSSHARVGLAGAYASSPITVTGLVAGTDTTIEFGAGTLSQVKFEAGSVASVWKALTAREELVSCQRYLPVFSPDAISAFAALGSGYATSTTAADIHIPFHTRTRASVTGITVLNPTHFYLNNSTTFTAMVFLRGGLDGVQVSCTGASGLSANQGVILATNTGDAKIICTGAEL